MGKISMEDDRGKERLKRMKEKFTCANCKNQTFILPKTSDFPFFDVICSKCGSLYIN